MVPSSHTRLAIDPDDPALGGNVIGGDRRTFHPQLWELLIQRLGVTSMLDVGCGEGHCVRWFAENGLSATGFDGLRQNVEQAVTPIEMHDLRAGPFIRIVDLVHCCEVVEHVEERYVDHVLATLANGRVIAMTHAVPGQGGHHHVNCQPAEYWIERIEQRGYIYEADFTAEARRAIEAAGHWTYFVATGLVFTRK